MSEQQASLGNITATVGEVFHVVLEVMGGTGYSWALAHMPDCVNLIDITQEHSQSLKFGNSERQIYSFVAVNACQSFLKFNLIRPWQPLEAAQSRTYALIITEPKKSESEELEESIAGRFAGAPAVGSGADASSNVMLYMAPFRYSMDPDASNAADCAASSCLGPIQPMYMPPLGVKYAPPFTPMYFAPVLKYAAPQVLKYAAPQDPANALKYAAPQIAKYAAPADVTTAVRPYEAPFVDTGILKYAAPCEEVNGVVKYAAPTGVKYAAPVAEYMAPTAPCCEETEAEKTEE
ncbi:hypothetical protein GTO91_06520 [Heliobacterium undosum]|uniref:Proteinase inhibitor I42 chagasin domain-containing protein n=1 Tax=Heliomicrobium undosum TaxID=121734 RepID=A0A845L2N6_9FIRM|nr:protease inhibitor I42 family protein [Heliomicrobium undosum]MZP29359.1 hypothetical protein [Heliomicrobium undosum]